MIYGTELNDWYRANCSRGIFKYSYRRYGLYVYKNQHHPIPYAGKGTVTELTYYAHKPSGRVWAEGKLTGQYLYDDMAEFEKNWTKRLPKRAVWSLDDIKATRNRLQAELGFPLNQESDTDIILRYHKNYRIKVI